MNKDAFLASFIGFGIGLLITGGVILGPKLLRQFRDTMEKSGEVASIQNTEGQITPTEKKQIAQQTLTIDQPQKETIVTKSTVTVSGKTPSDALLIVGSSEDEKIIETGTNTTYETTLSLKEGKNDISVVSVVGGKSTVERITVYYNQQK